MFFEEIRIKQGFSYIPLCSLRILYNSKSILMAKPKSNNQIIIIIIIIITIIILRVHSTLYLSGTELDILETTRWWCGR